MSEATRALPTRDELIALLPEGCRECFFALDNVDQARQAEKETGTVDSRAVAENIGKSCVKGWQDDQSPGESLAQENGDFGLRHAVVIEKFCPLGGNLNGESETSSP